jgi:hypothetical protein
MERKGNQFLSLSMGMGDPNSFSSGMGNPNYF